jgi:hypothetical protein
MGIQNMISFEWTMKHLFRNKVHFEVLENSLSELLHYKINIKNILKVRNFNDVTNAPLGEWILSEKRHDLL